MSSTNNVIGWFEIPVTDMERAMEFYGEVFGYKFERQQMGPFDMAFFPWNDEGKGAAGALVLERENHIPSIDGTLVYFTPPSGDLQNELSMVEDAGGHVIQEKTLITEEIGNMALFLDTEGNRIALHSRK